MNLNQIILLAGFVFFALFYMKARISAKQPPKEDKIAKQYEREERRRTVGNLDSDLAKIERELAPHLEDHEKIFDKAGDERNLQKKEHLKVVPVESKPQSQPDREFVTLEAALKGTKSGLMGRIRNLFEAKPEVTSSDLESIEEVLYTSDLGPLTVSRLIDAISLKISSAEKKDVETIRGALKEEMMTILEGPQTGLKSIERFFESGVNSSNRPEVWLVVGVNGAGKTTTIGKLAHKLSIAGKSVVIAAGDTFRAAASEQLKVWSERAEVDIYAPENAQSPSGLAFDAIKYATQRKADHLIIDTAGRLHTQKNLMEELKKVRRVCEKAFVDSGAQGQPAPHEVLLVLDANSGQNALIQAREFHQAITVTGIILTKLDGTAKGGVAVGIASEMKLPIQLIGVGEGKEDLRSFKPKEFVDAIL